MNANRNPGLDLLRGLAALGVVAFHLTQWAHASDPRIPVIQLGSLGVATFFVLSGFVITASARRTASRTAFARARFLRLYPAFVACMLITTACMGSAGLGLPSARDWLLNLTMMPALLGAQPVEAVYWTLAFEVWFYAVVWALLPLVRRGLAVPVCLAAIGLLAALLPVLIGLHSAFVLRQVSFFAVGLVLTERPRAAPIAAAAGIAATLVLLAAGDGAGALQYLAPTLVVAALHLPVPARLAVWVGAVSYPLYLVHDQVGCRLVTLFAGILGTPGALLAATVGVVALAAGIERWVERPARAWLAMRTKSRATAGPAPLVMETTGC